MKEWKVPLPEGAERPFRVFVSGVPQQEGKDYEVRGHALWFRRSLEKEKPLGLFRWSMIFLGLFGSYRRNDMVDVHYNLHGTTKIAVGLDIIPPNEDPADT